MKKKIGELYNKPVVIGDKNLVTKNETHISELQGNSNNEEGENGNIELTKGQKILSEYYYIDYYKLVADVEKDQNVRSLASFIGEMSGFDLDNKQTQSHIPFADGTVFMTEINHSIFKIAFDGIVVYLEDNFFQSSGSIDALQFAIRKYSKVVSDTGSGFIPTINNYISISTIYNNTYSGKSFEEIIAPYLITEEEFWAEAIIDA